MVSGRAVDDDAPSDFAAVWPMMARRLLVSAAWSISARVIGRLIDLVTLLVLARLLIPADFGVVAIAMTLVSILEAIFELPVGTVLLCKPEPDRADFDTAFTLAALRGVILAGVALLLAGPFAWLYGDARMIGLIAVLSLAPATRGLQSPKMIVFSKALDFRRSFVADVVGRGGACILACAVAFLWRDHWAIVACTVAGPAGASLASYVLAPYRPCLSLERWSAFSHFLGWSSAAQLVSALNWQCDRLLLGALVRPALLGQFSMASDLAALPNQSLLVPLMTPTLSAFTQIGDDRSRIQAAYERSVAALLTIGLPMLIGLSLTATPLVALLLGGKWSGASALLQWLILESVPCLFIMPAWPLALALGRIRLLFQRNLIELAIKIPMLVVAAFAFGIPGVVGSRIVMATIIAGVSMHMTRGLIGTPICAQVTKHWRPIVSCAAMAAVVTAVRVSLPDSASSLLQLTTEVGSGMATYVSVMLLFGFDPRQWLGQRSAPGAIQAPAE